MRRSVKTEWRFLLYSDRVVKMIYFWMCLGYLAGSCPTGFLITKMLRGIDIRTFGSGNIGATNAGRLLGKNWAFTIAAFDMLKGGVIVLVASHFTDSHLVLAATGVSSVIGHDYPIWLRFKGGKGVATTFGVFGFFDFFNPWPALIGGCAWYFIMKKSKYVSVASMFALFIATLLMPLFGMPRQYYFAGYFLSLLAIWRHSTNIVNIKKGIEDKVSQNENNNTK